jgi:hypothetical protein
MNEAYLGKQYRQVTAKLRINRGPGVPDKVTLKGEIVVFDEQDQVDVEFLLGIGAVVELEPEPIKKAVKVAGKEVTSYGESSIAPE